MKKLAKFSKKKKVLILLISIVVASGIAIGAMYATGVFPGQTKGAALGFRCTQNTCPCHEIKYINRTTTKTICHGCEKCCGVKIPFL